LVDDFGFTQKDIKLFFSGGRGYHCHVIHSRVQKLGSHERREIVDYITGKGLLTDKIFKERVYDKQGPHGQYKRTRLEIPKPTEGGWNGRISQGIIKIIEEIKEMEEEKAIVYLMDFAGITRKSAMQFIGDLTPEKITRIKEGILDQSTSIKKIFMKGAMRLSAMHAAGTDEPVTADIKRLIRLPGSLHGKTGLKVQSLTIDDLPQFNPLSDAVVFGDDDIQISVKKKVNITMKDHSYTLTEGKVKVPEYLAVFLIARGFANHP
jgi:DNA primase small subunit